MKPLWRWTIGYRNFDGFETQSRAFEMLKLSVKMALRIYKDEFDYVICYNNLSDERIKWIEQLGVPILHQGEYQQIHTFWKFVPSRLRIKSHELFVDNDLILEKRIPQLDEFLQDQTSFLITEGRNRCYGLFLNRIPSNLQLNAGFLGIPPNVKIGNLIQEKLNEVGVNMTCTRPRDEQGLLAHIVSSRKFIKIPLSEVSTIYSEQILQWPENSTGWLIIPPIPPSHPPGRCGSHFVGANYADVHYGWDRYKRRYLLYI